MLIFNSSGRAIWLALAGAATLLAGTVSRAEICSAEKFYNGTTYRYSICHVTDLDQRREELPPFTVGLPNGGKMYCAPTSAMNWMTYIANHGYPGIMPGPGYWGPESPPNQPQYNTMTSALAQMGSFMGTDPTDGTGGGEGQFGIQLWLGSPANLAGDFIVSYYAASGSYSPVFSDMALTALDGGLVIPVIGWYKDAVEAPEEIKQAIIASLGYLPSGFYRNGGHVLSMAKAKNDFQFQQVGLSPTFITWSKNRTGSMASGAHRAKSRASAPLRFWTSISRSSQSLVWLPIRTSSSFSSRSFYRKKVYLLLRS